MLANICLRIFAYNSDFPTAVSTLDKWATGGKPKEICYKIQDSSGILNLTGQTCSRADHDQLAKDMTIPAAFWWSWDVKPQAARSQSWTLGFGATANRNWELETALRSSCSRSFAQCKMTHVKVHPNSKSFAAIQE